MKIIVTSNNQTVLKITYSEWTRIGKNSGWIVAKDNQLSKVAKVAIDVLPLTKYFANASFFKISS